MLHFLYVFYGPNKFSYVFQFHVSAVPVSKKYNMQTKINGRKMGQKKQSVHLRNNTSRVKIEFVKDQCCGGKLRFGSLKNGDLEKKG